MVPFIAGTVFGAAAALVFLGWDVFTLLAPLVLSPVLDRLPDGLKFWG
jgi:hypothetical protein